MRSLSESRQRWAETGCSSIAVLQQAVKQNGPASPCETGLRSVCWKIFLLFRDAPAGERLRMLGEARADYEALGERYLQFIKHPERLTELTVDPLADDPESPWDTFRRDDVVRSEILQDVRRLPDEPFYHQEHIQTLILDVLFVYCKDHPRAGGYRQGMHELLAPLVYVLGQDAIDVADAAAADAAADAAAGAEAETDTSDASMEAMLDVRYMAHDSYALFSAVMEKAQGFYELSSNGQSSRSSTSSSNSSSNSSTSSTSDKNKSKSKSRSVRPKDVLAGPGLFTSPSPGPSAGVVEQSAIVEMSKAIHEGTLMKIDPELAVHLKEIEVLPQIFLIRWIRLLFGREFPFDQQLVLWDSIFAFDPDLDLVPLICVAMLLRVRWELLEADYSVALQLLLKYPPPAPPHGPHTFVDDALFLRDRAGVDGGASLVLKYTGRAPARQRQRQAQQQRQGQAASPSGSSSAAAAGTTSTSRPSTPNSAFAAGLDSLRHRTRMAVRSPLRALSPDAGDEEAGGGADRHTAASSSSRHGRATALSPSRFAPGREGVEALLQGAAKGAKGVMERGEKLGINRAVRDAVGEIRRNMMQGLQEARQATKAGGGGGGGSSNGGLLGASSFLHVRGRTGGSAGGGGGGGTDATAQVLQVLAEMERMEQRNRQLAAMLDETVEALRSLVAEETGGEGGGGDDGEDGGGDDGETIRRRRLDVVELAAAKVQFVKVHLEDNSLVLPLDELSEEEERVDDEKEKEKEKEEKVEKIEKADKERVEKMEKADKEKTDKEKTDKEKTDKEKTDKIEKAGREKADREKADKTDRENAVDGWPSPAAPADKGAPSRQQPQELGSSTPASALSGPATTSASAPASSASTPHTIPSRATLAQSSFAWMLEPEDTPDSRGAAAAAAAAADVGPDGSSTAAKKRTSRASPAGRGRHAFLFGDVVGASPLGGGDGSGDGGGGGHRMDSDPLMGGGSSGGSATTAGGRKRSSVTADEVFGLEPLLRRPVPKNE